MTDEQLAAMADEIDCDPQFIDGFREGYRAALAAQPAQAAHGRDCPHCNYTGTVHCGDVAEAIKANGGEPGHCSNATIYGLRAAPVPAPVQAGERRFPMQRGPSIPWSLAESIYAGYAALYGREQSLERLAERGGFSWPEVEVIYNDCNKRSKTAIDAAMLATKQEQP